MAVLKIRNNTDDGWYDIGGIGTVYQSDSAPGSPHAGQMWLDTDAVFNAPTYIQDIDGDTKVQCEESSDEDIIRMDIAGVETVKVTANGLAIFGGTGQSARLNLVADQAEDLDDYWRLLSNDIATDNTFSLDHYISTDSAYVNVITAYPEGEMTQPNQPSFSAYQSAGQTNIANGLHIQFQTEDYDVNEDYNTSTWYFTAPVDGKYYFTWTINLTAIDKTAAWSYWQINASNRSWYWWTANTTNFTADSNYHTFNGSCVVDMDANDTCRLVYAQSGGAAQADIYEGVYARFAGHLLG